MRIAMTLTAAVLALATSVASASAQRESGGTIGCDPGAPSFGVQATNCRIFFQESLYGPAANPYNAPWQGYAAAPVVRHRTVVHRHKARSLRKSGVSDGAAR